MGKKNKDKTKKQDATMEPIANERDAAEENEKAKKKKKKKKKAAVEEETEAVEEVVAPQEDEQKKKKKKKKSKAPIEEAIEDPTVVEAEGESEEAEKKKKKKKKKSKKVEVENGENGHANGVKRKREASEEEPAQKKKKKKSAGDFNSQEAQAFREKERIAVSGNNHEFAPILSFEDPSFPQQFRPLVKNFQAPTPIQSQCWPVCFAGRDVVGIAETGSGKTLGFTVPGMLKLLNADKQGVQMLVLAPTRELAQQTHKICEEVGDAFGVRSVCIYGGADRKAQTKAIKKGAKIVVACPGRLLDLVQEGTCSLSSVCFLVLDEADRMLDMGFEKDIRAILAQVTSKHQTAMFSATWPQEVRKIAEEYLNDPVQVNVGSDDLAASSTVTQIVEVMEQDQKEGRLLQLLDEYHPTGKNRVLVFALYKKEAARLEGFLRRKGWQCQSIHGDKSQGDREKALAAFKDGSEPLLIATDVAARGIDIKGITHVINVSFPLTIEDYVHRIGRTGRAGEKGIAHTFFTKLDKARCGELVNVLHDAKANVPKDLLKFGTDVKKKLPKVGKIDISAAPAANLNRVVFNSDSDSE